MKIQRIVCNMLQENCYVVSDETRECVIIDCGAYYEEERQALASYIRENQLVPKHLLVTHGHLDHNFGNEFLYKEFGLKPEISERDEHLINKLKSYTIWIWCSIRHLSATSSKRMKK